MLKIIGELWPVVITVFTVIFFAGSFNQRVEALDKKVATIEEIQKDIVLIRLKVERIDERLSQTKEKE